MKHLWKSKLNYTKCMTVKTTTTLNEVNATLSIHLLMKSHFFHEWRVLPSLVKGGLGSGGASIPSKPKAREEWKCVGAWSLVWESLIVSVLSSLVTFEWGSRVCRMIHNFMWVTIFFNHVWYSEIFWGWFYGHMY